MNKKEVAEIKKNFNDDNGLFVIDKVITAVVNNKDVVYSNKKRYAILPESEAVETMTLLKKTLTGGIGKTINEYAFPNEAETQSLLYKVNQSELDDSNLNSELLQKIAENLDYALPYSIFLANCKYTIIDKKNKSSSDFKFLISAICPINVRIDGFIYNDDKKVIERKIKNDKVLDKVSDGFMFPVFSERQADVNSVMYYCKKPSEPNVSFIEEFLGCKYLMPANVQSDKFWGVISMVGGKEFDYEKIAKINEVIETLVCDSEHLTDAREINSKDMERILKEVGFSAGALTNLQAEYDKYIGKKTLLATNICTDKVNIKSGETSINIGYKAAKELRTQNINGKKCIIIEVDEPQISVNGMTINI